MSALVVSFLSFLFCFTTLNIDMAASTCFVIHMVLGGNTVHGFMAGDIASQSDQRINSRSLVEAHLREDTDFKGETLREKVSHITVQRKTIAIRIFPWGHLQPCRNITHVRCCHRLSQADELTLEHDELTGDFISQFLSSAKRFAIHHIHQPRERTTGPHPGLVEGSQPCQYKSSNDTQNAPKQKCNAYGDEHVAIPPSFDEFLHRADIAPGDAALNPERSSA